MMGWKNGRQARSLFFRLTEAFQKKQGIPKQPSGTEDGSISGRYDRRRSDDEAGWCSNPGSQLWVRRSDGIKILGCEDFW